jgi:hypothetical protein
VFTGRPSGAAFSLLTPHPHSGHIRNFTYSDIIAMPDFFSPEPEDNDI